MKLSFIWPFSRERAACEWIPSMGGADLWAEKVFNGTCSKAGRKNLHPHSHFHYSVGWSSAHPRPPEAYHPLESLQFLTVPFTLNLQLSQRGKRQWTRYLDGACRPLPWAHPYPPMRISCLGQRVATLLLRWLFPHSTPEETWMMEEATVRKTIWFDWFQS